jgi:C-terminal processing protease CtpA/Prc
MDADWDDEFPKFLHTFVDAKNAREYHLAVAQAVTKLDDSHSEATSSELEDYFGRASVGIRLRLLEKKPLVTELLDDSAAAAGIQVGDIILRVDDENIVKRIDREAAYLPASSHQALSERVMRRILNGPAGSEALLTIRHHDGGEVDVRLKRTAEPVPERGSAMKQLSAKIGYIDLTRLQPGDVDAVFRQVADKETLVLDARGELLADARLLASHFNNKTGVAGAIVSGPLLLIPDLPKAATIADTHSFFSVESVPVSGGDFSGRVVMLVDGRTIGEAEHLGLLLEAARKIPFVGSESAGACGSVSHFALPGGIRVSFSSADVRHANTGKLQRVGLEPSAVTELTLADVRAGRDVVLEKALEYLSQHP